MIIDGKKIAEEIQLELKNLLKNHKGRKPCLAMITVGKHPASKIYINRKSQACENIGMLSIKRLLPEETSENELLKEVQLLNDDPSVDGILVQLPLPAHINPTKITQAIVAEKDVDGFHPINLGKLLTGQSDGFLPCTPLGIKVLLERSHIDVAGKHVVIMGRSNIVGKPVAAILLQNTSGGNATVTVVHRHTKDLASISRLADIIIVAMGQPQYLKANMIKEGAVVIDVGINKISDPSHPKGYQIVGDVDFENVKNKCSFITPVPGGVGPMTIAMLLQNTWLSYQRNPNNISLL